MSAWILGLVLACGVQSPDAKEPTQASVSSGAYVSAKPGALTGPFNNRLETADSPYLKMHGHDPVNWYPWGDEAFAEAKRRNVPVFLSIGYYACHWCHVMHRESFKDPVTAAILNEHFVAIKVDREERPDVDALYMDAVHILNRNNGGWPASIWLTPDRKPFFAGTYFPPEDRQDRPGFGNLLRRIAEDWETRPGDIALFADQTKDRILKRAQGGGAGVIPPEIGERAANQMGVSWNPDTRGFGTRRQFPMSPNLQFLLWHHAAHPKSSPPDIAVQQLRAMDSGGIHDQIGGGFHRYTVDPAWSVPHFEKMLYDNAQLLAVYAEASLIAGEPRFADVAKDIGAYLLRQMQHPEGGFFSSESADSSDGEEGAFYVWTPEEIGAIGPEAEAIIAAYGVTPQGNFEGNRTVLNRADGIDPNDEPYASARAALFSARARREAPPPDQKRVVAWNGMAIGALARSGRILDEPAFVAAAQRAAEAVLAAQDADGRLPRTLAVDAPVGVLQDYAFVGNGLLDLFETDGDARWLRAATATATAMIRQFQDPETGVLHQSDKRVELLTRKVELTDGAEPSGPGRALRLLARLHALGAPTIERGHIDKPLKRAAWILDRAPNSAPSLAHVADRMAERSTEIILATESLDHPDFLRFRAAFHSRVRPHTAFAAVMPTEGGDLDEYLALVGKVPGESGFQAYVCHNGACKQPTRDLAAFESSLNQP
ncbi:MAG: thioredoxin domain-containing protein [Myxococcota bacterium]|nr:thioredoxin domain-containing protein [Myxococcota bacterium]